MPRAPTAMLTRPFGAAEILTLAHNPRVDLESTRSPGGFSFPQRAWIYEPAIAYYQADRDPDVLWTTFAKVIQGRAMTPWKSERQTELRPMLARFLRLDSKSSAVFRRSAYARPARVVTWREHDLKIPLGLLMENASGIGLRHLWIEKMFVPGKRGVSLVLAATVASADLLHGPIAWIETWHLADGATRRYDAQDLRANWPRLDRLLAAGEERAGGALTA